MSAVWNFCKEANLVYNQMFVRYMQCVESHISSEDWTEPACTNPTLGELYTVRNFIDSVCPDCAGNLSTIEDIIDRGMKLRQVGHCCNMPDLCVFVPIIEDLRPVTEAKLLSPQWRDEFIERLNKPLCCVIQALKDAESMDNTASEQQIEIPNYTLGGLPGFDYPIMRTPPLFRLIREIQDDPANNESGGTEGSDGKHMSYNVDGESSVFGDSANMYNNHVSSPIKPIHDLICGVDVSVQMPGGFQPCVSIGLPDLTLGGQAIDLNIPPCISQFLPPMALPTVTLPTLSLGGGREFGIYTNLGLGVNNFGFGFMLPLPGQVMSINAPLNLPVSSCPRGHGINMDIDFPAYGKGIEWTLGEDD